MLYAENKHAILIVLQGMDASGKDGLIKDVFTSINPMGLQIHSFKAPTDEELQHDFLWRIHKHTPEKGMIAIFNRSHYEDILITRVNNIIDDDIAEKRIRAINDFENLLSHHNKVHILKFYLHISREEQQERLKERIHNPRKMWKYNDKDFLEATKWDKYISYYKEAFERCNQPEWHIIPSDQNWYKCYLVAKILKEKLKSLNMTYPKLPQ